MGTPRPRRRRRRKDAEEINLFFARVAASLARRPADRAVDHRAGRRDADASNPSSRPRRGRDVASRPRGRAARRARERGASTPISRREDDATRRARHPSADRRRLEATGDGRGRSRRARRRARVATRRSAHLRGAHPSEVHLGVSSRVSEECAAARVVVRERRRDGGRRRTRPREADGRRRRTAPKQTQSVRATNLEP